MPMTKKVAINGDSVRSLSDFYDQVSLRLGFPGHFGRTLDALWDVLSADVEGPFEITWKRSGLSHKSMGKDFDSLVILLRDLEAEREDFRFTLEP